MNAHNTFNLVSVHFTSHKDPWKLQFSKNVWGFGAGSKRRIEYHAEISQHFHRNYNSIPQRKSKPISACIAEVSREESQS